MNAWLRKVIDVGGLDSIVRSISVIVLLYIRVAQ